MTQTTATHTLSIQNLSKAYGSHVVVDKISHVFETGKVTSIIGPNGAGKSTVMGMIARLVDYSEGSINFGGSELSGWNSKELARELAILTQHNNTSMKLTVRELVSFGRFPYSGSKLTEYDYEKIDEALDYMELKELEDSFIDELSGGQQQRAFIAMVIAQDTDYVLLDEPTNNLDIYHASRLMKCVRRLADELGKTVIMVLHDINYAAFYSDAIVAMKGGKIHSAGPVADVMRSEVLEDIYQVKFQMMEVSGKPLSIYF